VGRYTLGHRPPHRYRKALWWFPPGGAGGAHFEQRARNRGAARAVLPRLSPWCRPEVVSPPDPIPPSARTCVAR
jgi:hypothetical protein